MVICYSKVCNVLLIAVRGLKTLFSLMSKIFFTDESLPLKAAFTSPGSVDTDCSWGKSVWSDDIPPSKSFTTWRFFHNKMPTNEHLQCRGCHLASRCSNCHTRVETSEHLFLSCSFVVKLWGWLAGILNTNIDTSSIESFFSVCNDQWSPWVKGVVTIAIIHTINAVWFCRNIEIFENKAISFLQAISRIKATTSLSGNNSKLMTYNSVLNFVILRQFN
ncbi:hypothetical protein Lal_00018180, partial [Lupinus albus]